MRPRHGFFNSHPTADAFISCRGSTNRSYTHLCIGLLPDLAQSFLQTNGAPLWAPVQVRIEDDATLVLFTAHSRVHLNKRVTDVMGGGTYEEYETTFSEKSALGVIPRFHHFGRFPVKAHLLEKEVRIMLPRTLLKQSVVSTNPLHEATKQAVAVLPVLLREGGPTSNQVTLEAPRTRTLLLEREGEIATYALPERIAEAIASLAAPYRS